MTAKQLIILLISSIYAGQVGLITPVICRGTDGHIKIENSHHDHCFCQIFTSRTVNSDGFYFTQNHRHCEDSPILVKSITKFLTKTSIDNTSLLNVYAVEASLENAFSAGSLLQHTSIFEPYFSPLNTIILQA